MDEDRKVETMEEEPKEEPKKPEEPKQEPKKPEYTKRELFAKAAGERVGGFVQGVIEHPFKSLIKSLIVVGGGAYLVKKGAERLGYSGSCDQGSYGGEIEGPTEATE